MKKWPECLGVMLEFWYSQHRFTDTNRREFIRYASKIVHEWLMNGNGHLEIFSLSQAIENFREFLLLRTDILQKTVVGCSWWMTVTGDCLEVFSFSVTQSPFGFANVEIMTVPTTSFIYKLWTFENDWACLCRGNDPFMHALIFSDRACRLFSRGVIFTRARVSLALLSLRKNGGLLVV